MASREGYHIRTSDMQANLDVDKRQLQALEIGRQVLVERNGSKRVYQNDGVHDLLGRTREQILRAIDWQERVLAIRRRY